MEFRNFSNELYMLLFGWASGNRIFNMEHIDMSAEVRNLSSKYKGEIGFISSVLKYPS